MLKSVTGYHHIGAEVHFLTFCTYSSVTRQSPCYQVGPVTEIALINSHECLSFEKL